MDIYARLLWPVIKRWLIFTLIVNSIGALAMLSRLGVV